MAQKLSPEIVAEVLAKPRTESNRAIAKWILETHRIEVSHQAVGNLRKRQGAGNVPAASGKAPKVAAAPAKRPAHRPTLCTPETIAAIAKELRHGATYKMAANLAGISYDSLNEWMRRGEAGEEPFSELRQAVTRAHEQFRRTAVRRIREGALSSGLRDWKAWAWLLEHHPATRDEFASQQQVTVKVERALEEKLDQLEKTLPPDEYRRVLCALAGAAGGEAPGEARH